MSVAEYVDLLEKNSAELPTAGATGEYELSVAAAWNVPLNRLRTDRRAALELLQVCAFFSPEPIARSLFTGVRGAPVPPSLAEALADPIKLNSAIREIHRYSLAKIDHARNTIQLHRLVQAVLLHQLDKTKWEDTPRAVHLILVNGDPATLATAPTDRFTQAYCPTPSTPRPSRTTTATSAPWSPTWCNTTVAMIVNTAATTLTFPSWTPWN